MQLTGFHHVTAICSDLPEDDAVAPLKWFVEGKEPWPTLTGRQQFYIDHPWYLETGEALPVHKELQERIDPGLATN